MTRKTLFLSTILVATLFAGGAVAVAQMPGGGPGMGMGGGMGMNPNAPWRARFADLDRNGDGAISRDEMRAGATDVFAAMDADGDGALTKDEYMSVRMGPQGGGNPARMEARQAAKAARFAPMDTNRDGKVDAAEFIADHDAMFRRIDRDGDGRVVAAEFRGHGW